MKKIVAILVCLVLLPMSIRAEFPGIFENFTPNNSGFSLDTGFRYTIVETEDTIRFYTQTYKVLIDGELFRANEFTTRSYPIVRLTTEFPYGTSFSGSASIYPHFFAVPTATIMERDILFGIDIGGAHVLIREPGVYTIYAHLNNRKLGTVEFEVLEYDFLVAEATERGLRVYDDILLSQDELRLVIELIDEEAAREQRAEDIRYFYEKLDKEFLFVNIQDEFLYMLERIRREEVLLGKVVSVFTGDELEYVYNVNARMERDGHTARFAVSARGLSRFILTEVLFMHDIFIPEITYTQLNFATNWVVTYESILRSLEWRMDVESGPYAIAVIIRPGFLLYINRYASNESFFHRIMGVETFGEDSTFYLRVTGRIRIS